MALVLANAAHLAPSRDVLARTLESLSLASTPPEPLGRLTQPLQPGGFEVLAGIVPSASTLSLVRPTTAQAPAANKGTQSAERSGAAGGNALRARSAEQDAARARAEAIKAAAAERVRARELERAARLRDAAITKAEAAVARAREKESDAERAWRRAQEEVGDATRALRKIQADS